ncbi:SDR family NAD(P)-dependent oxidoreductase [Paenarthrobacter sp. NPDC090522]|uniref:SDR family NAD(P)-dependent oxidoreductase n=1 Tax=Paenarthrobacter sp. NPDC090522 TaxID=3364383 RepID=UPI00382FF3F6
MDDTKISRRVVVTGGASGIGLAVAKAYLDSGAQVGVVDLTSTDELSVYGNRVHTRIADVSVETKIATAIDELSQAMEGVDTLVACAGIDGELGASVAEATSAGFRRVLEVNVLGVFHTVKHALPHLIKEEHASVTIIGSDSGFVSAPGMLAYEASKGALVQVTKALSLELYVQHGIRVNSVCPSIVDTPMARKGLGVESFEGAPYPVNRPEDVARSVLFLSSFQSRGINGVNLLSDFGFSARSSFVALEDLSL